MKLTEALAVCDRISCKPGWVIEAKGRNGNLVLRLSFIAPCAVTGEDATQISMAHCCDALMLECMDERALLNRLLWCFRQAEEHVLLKFFKLDGVAIYDPHKP